MSQWSRIILPARETEAMDTATKLAWVRARAAAGNDPAFAAFRTMPPDNELYFSPAAEEFALGLGARSCAPPMRANVGLCNSDHRAWDLCFSNP